MRKSSNDAMVFSNVTFMKQILPFLSVFHRKIQNDDRVDLEALRFFVSLRGVSTAWMDAMDNWLGLHSVALGNVFSVAQFYRNVFDSTRKVYEQDDQYDFRSTEVAMNQSFKIASVSLPGNTVIMPALNSFLDEGYRDIFLYERGQPGINLRNSEAINVFLQLFLKNFKSDSGFFKAIYPVMRSKKSDYLPIHYSSFVDRYRDYLNALICFVFTSSFVLLTLPAYLLWINQTYHNAIDTSRIERFFLKSFGLTVCVIFLPLVFYGHMSSMLAHVNFLKQVEQSCKSLDQASQSGKCEHLSSWASSFFYKHCKVSDVEVAAVVKGVKNKTT